MSKEAIAKYAFKSFMGTVNQSDNAHYQAHQRDLEQQQQQAKKYWWSKAPAADAILTKEERRLLRKVKSRAHFLDQAVSCCCFRIGFDGLIGLIPVVGDFIGFLLALNLVHLCMQADLPNELVSKMMFNIGVDFVIGLVPLVGDLMDIMYKCNTKNAILLESYLIKRRRQMLRHDPRLSTGRPSHLGSTHQASAPAIMK